MEFSFSDEPKKGGTPATKVYAPKKKTASRPGGGKGRAREKTDATAEETGKGREPEPVTPASRIGIMLSGFLFAGMVLFTLTGYERISRAYADINTINSAIDETQLRIKALDVQIECAVTIQDAQDTAEAYGMQYPTQSQYVRADAPIPLSGAAPAGANPGETVVPGQLETPAEPETPVEPDTSAEPDAPTEDTPSDD